MDEGCKQQNERRQQSFMFRFNFKQNQWPQCFGRCGSGYVAIRRLSRNWARSDPYGLVVSLCNPTPVGNYGVQLQESGDFCRVSSSPKRSYSMMRIQSAASVALKLCVCIAVLMI